MKIRSLLSTAACLVFVGCSSANQGDVRRLEVGLTELRSLQAETTTRMSDLEQELRQLSGRLEEIEFKTKRSPDVDSLKNDLNQLKRRIPPPAIVPTALLETDERYYAQQEKGTDLGTVLDEAFLALREGRFDNADNALARAYDQATKKQDKANVLFWIGITKEARAEYKRALEAFLSGIAENPTSPKIASSLLRQSGVLLKLGDTKGARAALNKIVEDFPKSDEATKAKDRLKSLGK